jgi:hypothetical protein
MSLQVCINCRELGITWYMDDADRTWWHCSECDFKIEEDERKECCCGTCKSQLPSVSWLIGDEDSYYWCFTCNSRTTNVLPRPDNETLVKLLLS